MNAEEQDMNSFEFLNGMDLIVRGHNRNEANL